MNQCQFYIRYEDDIISMYNSIKKSLVFQLSSCDPSVVLGNKVGIAFSKIVCVVTHIVILNLMELFDLKWDLL